VGALAGVFGFMVNAVVPPYRRGVSFQRRFSPRPAGADGQTAVQQSRSQGQGNDAARARVVATPQGAAHDDGCCFGDAGGWCLVIHGGGERWGFPVRPAREFRLSPARRRWITSNLGVVQYDFQS